MTLKQINEQVKNPNKRLVLFVDNTELISVLRDALQARDWEDIRIILQGLESEKQEVSAVKEQLNYVELWLS